MHRTKAFRFLSLLITLALASSTLGAATAKKRRVRKTTTPTTVSHNTKVVASAHASRLTASSKRKAFSPWSEPTYADSTDGDFIDGEDLAVRRAAVEALGPYNGSVVVTDPQNGRVLTIVNQKVALKTGFQPCSTIKLVAALAGLSEGLIERNTMIRLYGRTSMGLTEALAHSNNYYFATVGQKLGFDRVSYYAKLYGLGEKAGLNIPGEQPGVLPPTPPKNGGVGMMTSFGEGISLTPLQLASLMTSIANGGTMYYLQHPRSTEESDHFVPRVKRQLDIAPFVPEIRPGMMGAVEYGTARRANFDPTEPIFGKTGTCTDYKVTTHMGWFGSFNEVGSKKLVVVVMLTGGKGVSGPFAAGIAGQVYKNLAAVNYLKMNHTTSPVALISTQSCCAVKPAPGSMASKAVN